MMKSRLLVISLALLMVACTKHNEKAEIDLRIHYEVNGRSLVTDSLCYENKAGNQYLITEIQWFLSNIELKNETSDWTLLHQRSISDTMDVSRIFYIDTEIPESQTLLGKEIPVGHYTALRFTFGLDETDNQTGLFSDSPESEMFWPDVLGGGYHYMKLNGKYLDADGQLAPLAIHLGIGQNENLSEFYHNYFIVELPIDFTVTTNAKNQLDLTMVVDNWFSNPNTIDFNEFGSGIMQNQSAQRRINGNGKDVFRIGKLDVTENNMEKKKADQLAEKFRNVLQKAAPKPHFWSWESVKERFEDFKISDF